MAGPEGAAAEWQEAYLTPWLNPKEALRQVLGRHVPGGKERSFKAAGIEGLVFETPGRAALALPDAVLGDLFAGEADLLSRLERPVDSLGSAINALGLYLEAELSGLPPEGSVRGKIEAMLTWVKPEEIPDETWFSLFSYGEQSGDLCTAYDALERLIAHTGLQPDLVNVAREFYQGLLIRPSKELETAGITLTEIQSALQRVESAR
jgi:hypothetical protein